MIWWLLGGVATYTLLRRYAYVTQDFLPAEPKQLMAICLILGLFGFVLFGIMVLMEIISRGKDD